MNEPFAKSRGKDSPQKLSLSKSERCYLENANLDFPPTLPEDNSERVSIVGTLSFPVRGRVNCTLRDNSDIIAEIIRRRRPALLLCAGWSINSTINLAAVRVETRRAKTVVLLEMKKAYWELRDGQSRNMGEQIFSKSKDIKDNPQLLDMLTKSLSKRSFRFHGRKAILLTCGELNLMQGRTKVQFHRSAPAKLQDALRAEDIIVLNPTHTRMGNDGTVKAKRKFLSEGRRTYVSVSNWDVFPKKNRRSQIPSATLHSLWYDGKPKKPEKNLKKVNKEKHACFVYREWKLLQ